jgi:hypothetical protein
MGEVGEGKIHFRLHVVGLEVAGVGWVMALVIGVGVRTR